MPIKFDPTKICYASKMHEQILIDYQVAYELGQELSDRQLMQLFVSFH